MGLVWSERGGAGQIRGVGGAGQVREGWGWAGQRGVGGAGQIRGVGGAGQVG